MRLERCHYLHCATFSKLALADRSFSREQLSTALFGEGPFDDWSSRESSFEVKGALGIADDLSILPLGPSEGEPWQTVRLSGVREVHLEPGVLESDAVLDGRSPPDSTETKETHKSVTAKHIMHTLQRRRRGNALSELLWLLGLHGQSSRVPTLLELAHEPHDVPVRNAKHNASVICASPNGLV